MTLNEALLDGRVYIRKAWINSRNPNQVAVQFIQEIPRDLQGTPQNLISLAQGNESFNTQRVVTIFSFRKDIAEKHFKQIPFDNSEKGEPICADDIFGCKVSIQVVENFTKHPKSLKQEPKKNPANNRLIKGRDVDGKLKPIYRHTTLIQGHANHKFIKAEYESYTEEGVANDIADSL
jgi:hypothetical protein